MSRAIRRTCSGSGGVRCRSISRELGYQGIDDENVRPLLLRLKKPTFLTRDEDFFRREFDHAGYCLVWLDAAVEQTAFFVRRSLNHPRFRANAQRLGCVIRVRTGRITYWTKNAETLAEAAWVD